jgi:hypothetical protein
MAGFAGMQTLCAYLMLLAWLCAVAVLSIDGAIAADSYYKQYGNSLGPGRWLCRCVGVTHAWMVLIRVAGNMVPSIRACIFGRFLA